MPATMRSALVAHSRRCRPPLPRLRSSSARAMRRTSAVLPAPRGPTSSRLGSLRSRRARGASWSNIGSMPTVGGSRPRARERDPVLGDRLERRRRSRRARRRGAASCTRRLDRAPLDDLLVDLAAQVVERRGVVADQRGEHERADRVGHGGEILGDERPVEARHEHAVQRRAVELGGGVAEADRHRRAGDHVAARIGAAGVDVDLDAAQLELLGPQVARGVVAVLGDQRGLRREARERGRRVVGHRGGRRRVEQQAVAAQQHRGAQPAVVRRDEHAERRAWSCGHAAPREVPRAAHARSGRRGTWPRSTQPVAKSSISTPNGSPARSGGAIRDRARHRQQRVGVRRQRAAGLEHALELAARREVRAQRVGGGARRARADLDAHHVGLGGGARAASTCRARRRARRARTGRAARATTSRAVVADHRQRRAPSTSR